MNDVLYCGRLTRDPEPYTLKNKKNTCYKFELAQQKRPYAPIYVEVHCTHPSVCEILEKMKVAKGDLLRVQGHMFNVMRKDGKLRLTNVRAYAIWLVNRALANIDTQWKNVEQPEIGTDESPPFQGV